MIDQVATSDPSLKDDMLESLFHSIAQIPLYGKMPFL